VKNFAKSILNYFAAFNETRFRFSSKLPYEWSNDPLTLDFSVFPAFEKQLLARLYHPHLRNLGLGQCWRGEELCESV